jgi:hypothetical protein
MRSIASIEIGVGGLASTLALISSPVGHHNHAATRLTAAKTQMMPTLLHRIRLAS